MTHPIALPAPVALLAAIPSYIGARPTDRIVVVAMDRDGPTQVISHTLPWRGDPRTMNRVAKDLAREIAENGRTHWIMIAVFCRSIAGGLTDRPYERLLYLVAAAAHRWDIHLAESYYVAANGWGSFTCDDPRCELVGPRPISELEQLAELIGVTF